MPTMSVSHGRPDPLGNPYAAPTADLIPSRDAFDAGTSAVDVRRSQIARETAIRVAGLHGYFWAIAWLVLAVIYIAQLVLNPASMMRRGDIDQAYNIGFFVGSALPFLFLIGLSYALGRDLRRLLPWARWMTIAVLVLTVAVVGLASIVAAFTTHPVFALISFLIWSATPICLLALLFSPQAGTIFSRTYRDVVKETTAMPARWGFGAVLLLVLLILETLGLVLSAFVVALRRFGLP
jgi:hypothetical protein